MFKEKAGQNLLCSAVSGLNKSVNMHYLLATFLRDVVHLLTDPG